MKQPTKWGCRRDRWQHEACYAEQERRNFLIIIVILFQRPFFFPLFFSFYVTPLYFVASSKSYESVVWPYPLL